MQSAWAGRSCTSFKDEGPSGYSGEFRPGFEDMLKFLSKGHVQVLIARHHDRLTRNAEDFDRLMKTGARSPRCWRTRSSSLRIPYKIVDGRRHYTIRAIPYQDAQQEAERLKSVHEAWVKIVPRV